MDAAAINTNLKASHPEIPIARIVLPPEHGSWSLLLEPLVTGFAIAFSPAVPWIALMTVGAFFGRQPLKWRVLAGKNSPVARMAEKCFLLFFLITLVGAIGVALNAGTWAFFPLAVAAPMAIQQLVLDISTRGRSLIAELAGAVAISSSVAVMVVAAGLGLPSAIALWVVFACRFVPSILYVRNRLLLEKGKRAVRTLANVAHLVALLIVTAFAIIGLASFFTLAVFVFLLIRSLYGLAKAPNGTKAMVIGIWEVIFGALMVASIVVGYYAGI